MHAMKRSMLFPLIGATAVVTLGCSDPSLQPADDNPPSSITSVRSSPIVSKELRAAYIAAVQAQVSDEYGVQSFGDAKYLHNPAQEFSLTFDADSVLIVPERQTWHLALRYLAVGCVDAAVPASKATLRAAGNRVDIERGQIEEWYTNGPLGVEQGFVLPEAPACSGFKTFRWTVEGDAVPVLENVDANGRGSSVRFVDKDGQTKLFYSDLFVRDAQGRTLPAWLSVQENQLAIVVDDANAAYPIVVDPLIGTLQQKLLASNGKLADLFGAAVAIEGNTAVVGAINDDQQGQDAGAAYVFVRQANMWVEEKKLVAADAAPNAHLGQSVAIWGTTILVGASQDDDKGIGSGSAYVFVQENGVWIQQAKLVASDGSPSDAFGVTVALENNTAVVGAAFGNGASVDSGVVYVFERNGLAWAQQAKIAPLDGMTNSDFGGNLGLSNDTLLIGADGYDVSGVDSGAAYVYVRAANTWNLQAKIIPSDGGSSDGFGSSVAISGDTAMIGAYGDDDVGADSGSMYVYTRNGAVWTQQTKLYASDGTTGDAFGLSVSLWNDLALVGAPFDDPKGSNSGSVYVFERNGLTWNEALKIVPDDGAPDDWFAHSLSLRGDMVVVGARYDDDKGVNSGSAYVYLLQRQNGDPCTTSTGCVSGYCVDGVCCDRVCGGGDPGDCLACNTSNGASANGVCGAAALGTVCRNALDICDVAETCDGTNTACPMDEFANTSVVCRAAVDACDAVETCDGITVTCPLDQKESVAVVCRAAGGECDVAETCDGTNDACPMDVKADKSVVCRAAGGECDVTETCDGTNDACPMDAKADKSVVCRAAGGECDVTEMCDGTNDACPMDAKADKSVVCRDSKTTCDSSETCDGIGNDCPSDANAPMGTPCAEGTCNDGICIPNGAGGAGGDPTIELPPGCACDVSAPRHSESSALAFLVVLGAWLTRRREGVKR